MTATAMPVSDQRDLEGPASVHKPVSTIETDTYCTTCNFNLHTQPVWRDERLNILVCRCPECGQHHPAGLQTTAPSSWRGRFAFLILSLWILFVLGLSLATFMSFFGVHMGIQDEVIRSATLVRDGEFVRYDWQNAKWIGEASGQVIPQEMVVIKHRIAPWIVNVFNGSGRADDVIGLAFVTLLCTFGTLIISAFFATVTWFWPRWRRLLWLVIPVAASTLALLIIANKPHMARNAGVPLPLIGPNLQLYGVFVIAFLELAVMAIGLHFGLRLSRGLIRLLLPPRARQYFAALWLTEGLTPPLKP